MPCGPNWEESDKEQKSTEPRLSAYLHARACAKGIPLAGNFELTARCNFNCRMCYVHLTPEEQRRRGAELTADEWLAIAEQARSQGMLFLLLTGGEPLIRADFRYLLTELKKMGLMVSINSNASLIDDDWLDFFRHEPPSRMNITLYGGCNETYERLCGRPMYDRVVHNIRALKALGIGVKLNASMTPYNVDDMDAIYAIATELGTPVQMASYMFPPVRRDEHATGSQRALGPAAVFGRDVLPARRGDACRYPRAGERSVRRDAGGEDGLPRGAQLVLDQLARRHDAVRHDGTAGCLRAGARLCVRMGGNQGGHGAHPAAAGVHTVRI